MFSPQIHNTFGSLGAKQGDGYKVSENCLSVLEDILQKLSAEDQTLRTFRRAIGFGENIRNDLIPLLIYLKDDSGKSDVTKIIDTTIKILLNLTIPVECLLSIETVSSSDVGEHTIFELNKLLTTTKEAFTDSRSTKAITDHMKRVIDFDSEMDVQQCVSVNNCLLLLRNILHIPENKASTGNCLSARHSMQNEIIWNLFTQSIDKIIVYLLCCPQKSYWGVTMVQLIAVMYKDQHVGALQKLLNLWLEASLDDSSDDNESNTSPQNQGSGGSSPMVTSDPTSDSSDNGGNERKQNNCTNDSMRNTTEDVWGVQTRSKTFVGIKRTKSTETENSTSSGISTGGTASDSNGSQKYSPSGHVPEKVETKAPKQTGNPTKQAIVPSSQSEISDCGYGTQVENQESVSTSSNDDDQFLQKPVHQKPHTFQKSRYNNKMCRTVTVEKKEELRRKKLVKRGKTNILNMKGLLHHTPTDDNISNILKEFTVDFLLKGYGNLVNDLHSQLLTNIHLPIDTSHFFWLVTYFLKFATQLELDLEQISPVLSYNIISYLVFQGVWLYEELEINLKIPGSDLKPCLRRLHLVVTAIREFVQAVEMYPTLTHLNDGDRAMLLKLQRQIIQTKDLRHLFLLLLRQYNPNLQSKQYLEDLIITNHNYLLFLDNISKSDNTPSNDMLEHLKEFGTVEIMQQYGLQLENFKENGEFVNNCVFTMMHHIGGDLKHVSTLFQPSILKTFSQIWETDYKICDDWADLIEYVMHKFINTPRSNHCSTLIKEADEQETLSTKHSSQKDGSEEEDCIEDENPNINDKCAEETCTETLVNSDIIVLREYLCNHNKSNSIVWLQNIITEACYVKLVLGNSNISKDTNFIVEPSVYYYSLLHLPIPVVPWTSEHFNTLKEEIFIRLLHKLGFYLPADTGKIFVRIPNFWTADYLFSIAQQLGPIDSAKLKFDVSLLSGYKDTKTEVSNVVRTAGGVHKFSLVKLRPAPSMVRYTPVPNSMEWMETILEGQVLPGLSSNNDLPISIPGGMQPELNNLSSYVVHPTQLALTIGVPQSIDMDILTAEESLDVVNDDNEHNSISETESVASDLTRMYVSDEDDKIDYVKETR